MNWLTSNLILIFVLAAISLIVFFISWGFKKPSWLFLGISVLLFIAGGFGVVKVLNGTPGQVETEDEKLKGGTPPNIPQKALERLRLDWNSQDVANWSAAETLADLSEIAYQPPFEAEKSYQALGFTKVMPIVQGSMIGYVITGEDVTVVAFRGTDFNEVSDWIANLDRATTDTPHGQVHRGFYTAYQSMKSQVDAILKERDTKQLWVTGHSLGGALAVLCAYDLETVQQRKLNGVMTFGQPMVARKQFADHIDTQFVGRYARFVNRDDIVPKIPPSHVACGSLVWFTDMGLKRSKIKPVSPMSAPPSAAPTERREANTDEAEITPLSEAEFKALQARLKAATAAADRLPEGTPVPHATVSTLIDDHSMLLYHEKIRTLLGVGPR